MPDGGLTIDHNTVINHRSGSSLLFNQTGEPAMITDNVLVNVGTLSAPTSANASGNTTPTTPHSFQGPLLGINGANGEGQIAEFDGTGTSIGGLAQPSGIVGNSGIASLNGNIYVANRIQGVGHLDPLTGSSTGYAGPQGIEGLGVYGSHLIGGVYDTDSIVEFAINSMVEPHPEVMATIMLQTPGDRRLGITGLDSNDDTLFYVGSYLDGNVYTFDPSGAFQGEIVTGLGANALSGLAYDRGNDTLWLATGFDGNQVLHYSLEGMLLGSFAAPIDGIGGLAAFTDDIVGPPPGPPSAVPEPPAGAMFAFGGVVWLAARRRRMQQA